MTDEEKEAEPHALHWEELARKERERLTYDRHAHPATVEVRARTYGNTAKAIRLTATTGVWHCACHLSPIPRDSRF